MEDESDIRVPAEEDGDGDMEFLSTMDAIVEEFVDIEHAPFSDFGFPDASEASGDYIDYDQFDIGPIEWTLADGKLQKRLRVIWNPTLRDKLTFLIGNGIMWSISYWLGRSPETFYKLYTVQVVVLGLVRFAVYRLKKWHYYLLDFCYYANLLLLVHLWLLPRSQLLNKVSFAYASGPLTWSIIAFRNSMVYHDLDKVTSVYFHLGPACVVWALKWHPDKTKFGPADAAPEDERLLWHSATFTQLVWLPLLPYLLWAVAYYLKIFVISADRIQQRGYSTLFTYTTTRSKGVYASIASRVPKPLQPPVYLFLHMLFCFTTFSFAWFCWWWYWFHTLLLAAMGAVSVWHGGNYYFTVLARGKGGRPSASGGTPLSSSAGALLAAPAGSDVTAVSPAAAKKSN